MVASPEFQKDSAFTPPVAQSIEDTGLSENMLQQLILKILYFRSEMVGRDLARHVGLNFSIIENVLEFFKLQHLVAVKRSYGMGTVSAVFALSDQGRELAQKYMETNTYAGKAPVPLSQYVEGIRRQRRKNNWLTLDKLRAAFSHMTISSKLLNQIGPAVNSGKSFLIYGQPGNGKTYIAEALLNMETDSIYIPYAIESQGQIIQMFDPIYHHRLDQDEEDGSIWRVSAQEEFDGRWFRAKRPFVVSGGELNLDMLDLAYRSDSKTYDAPFQLKANNGIYLVDDFGRQKVSPTEVLNRWIVPMERGIDYYSFLSGGKISVPFETFLIFSTNLRPEQIGDEAFLRRIQYKMFLRSPEEQEFVQIFDKYCKSEELPIAAGALDSFLSKHYRSTGKPFRRCHPRDVVTHAIDLIRFEGLRWELTAEVLDRAFECTFVSDEFDK
jgi:predicted ATPase with chaperone activity